MPNKKTQEEIAIEVKNSFKERILFLGRNKKKEKREILKDINLTIKKGEVVGLIGINGSRKINIIKTYDKNNISR